MPHVRQVLRIHEHPCRSEPALAEQADEQVRLALPTSRIVLQRLPPRVVQLEPQAALTFMLHAGDESAGVTRTERNIATHAVYRRRGGIPFGGAQIRVRGRHAEGLTCHAGQQLATPRARRCRRVFQAQSRGTVQRHPRFVADLNGVVDHGAEQRSVELHAADRRPHRSADIERRAARPFGAKTAKRRDGRKSSDLRLIRERRGCEGARTARQASRPVGEHAFRGAAHQHREPRIHESAIVAVRIHPCIGRQREPPGHVDIRLREH